MFKSAFTRIFDFSTLPFKLFDVIRQQSPEALNKLIPIEGDVGVLGLGLSAESLEIMKGVSVIFHSAASVRFDDLLKSAIILNTRGTLEVLKFGLSLRNLAAFVHVSTTYCYPDQRKTDEQVKTKL